MTQEAGTLFSGRPSELRVWRTKSSFRRRAATSSGTVAGHCADLSSMPNCRCSSEHSEAATSIGRSNDANTTPASLPLTLHRPFERAFGDQAVHSLDGGGERLVV